MKSASYFFAGLLFAIGLAVGGMTQPQKIIGFLDVTGNWDPSLAFVMIGAIGVHAVTYRLTMRRTAPLFAERFFVPKRSDIDPRLVLGAAIFGMGWGLGGYCPGPALVAAGAVSPDALLFLGATIAGHWLFGKYDRWSEQRASRADSSGTDRNAIGST